MRYLILSMFVFVNAACSQSTDQTLVPSLELEPGELHVTITASQHGDPWQVTYQMGASVEQLLFARSNGDYRTSTWIMPEGFELVRQNNLDTIRRSDGTEFTRLDASFMPYDEANIIGDYAPYIAFSDGASVIFTGQFSVGQRDLDMMPAEGESAYTGIEWFESVTMVVRPGPYSRSVSNNGIQQGAVTLNDASGEFIYFGDGHIEQTEQMNIINDPDMPPWMTTLIVDTMTPLSHFYHEAIVERADKPLLITAYGLLDEGGLWSLKGDVIANQVLLNLLFEPEYAEEGRMNDAIRDLVAHEVAHLWQVGQKGGGWYHWLTEGGAEAISQFGLHEIDHISDEELLAFFNRNLQECAQMLSNGPYREAHQRGDYWAGYRCGAIVHYSADSALKAAGHEGFIPFISNLMARDDWDGVGTWRLYLEDLSEAGATGFAETLEAFVVEPENPSSLQDLLTAASVDFRMEDGVPHLN